MSIAFHYWKSYRLRLFPWRGRWVLETDHCVSGRCSWTERVIRDTAADMLNLLQTAWWLR